MKRVYGLLTALRESAASFKMRPDLQYLLITAMLLRLLYMAFMLGQITPADLLQLTPDTARYVNLGRELLDGHILDEAAVLIFGPGYGSFLGAVFFVFGISAIAVIFIQTILSSLSCLLIYRLGHELTESRPVGLIAGYVAALSFTSISLANIILSDTLFFFLFLSGNVLLWLGMKKQKRYYAILSGITIGLAILTRTIGQFWPIMMFGLILLLPAGSREGWWKLQRARLKLLSLAPAIAIVIMSLWVARNYYKDDTLLIAIAGSHGLSKVTAIAQARATGNSVEAIRTGWIEEYRSATGREEVTWTELADLYNRQALKTLIEHPGVMLVAYGELVFENVTAVNELYRSQLPLYQARYVDFFYALREYGYHAWCLGLSLLGFVCLGLRRQWVAFAFLALIYVYIGGFMGFGQWQGSRLFFPAQIAWAILIAVVIMTAIDGMRRICLFAYKKARPIKSAGPQ